MPRNAARRDLWPRFESAAAATADIRQMTDTVMVSLSRGKDSLGAWLALNEARPTFARIIPVFYWLVPGLRCEEEYLTYLEGKIGTRIYRLPSPSFWRDMAAAKWQPPDHLPILNATRMPAYSGDDLFRWLWEDLGGRGKPWIAIGVRAVDSPERWTALKRNGFINYVRQVWYPVADWKVERLSRAISASGIQLPADYHIWGRSFDGLGRLYLRGLKQYYPDDYQRVLEYFPLAEADLMRETYAQRHDATK